MSLLLRVVVAVLAGVILTALLDYFNVLTPQLNALLGLLLGVLVFWRYDYLPR